MGRAYIKQSLSIDPEGCARVTRSPDMDARDALVGVTLDGRFRVEAVVGEGGFGVVYRATQLNVGREVAVKVLRPEVSASARHAERFETEARIISQLRHPNTLKLVDFGRAPDARLYFVTEYLHGASLDARIAAGDLSPPAVVRLLVQICDALAEAHERGVVHCDLKPRNIFVERVGGQWIAKVHDFGIARLRETAEPLDALVWSSDRGGAGGQSRIAGTPAYMSPEQLRGGLVDARSDLYALGVVAYECLAGAPPFEDPDSLALDHLASPPLPFGERQPAVRVDPPLEALVLQLLAKHPDDRPASAQTVRAQLVALEATAALADRPAPRARGPASAHATVTSTLDRVTPLAHAQPAKPSGAPYLAALGGMALVAAGVFVATRGERSVDALPAPVVAPESAPESAPSALAVSASRPAARTPVSAAVVSSAAVRIAPSRPPRPREVARSVLPAPPLSTTPPSDVRSARRLPGFFQVKTTP